MTNREARAEIEAFGREAGREHGRVLVQAIASLPDPDGPVVDAMWGVTMAAFADMASDMGARGVSRRTFKRWWRGVRAGVLEAVQNGKLASLAAGIPN